MAAKAEKDGLQEGAPAPDFSLEAEDGDRIGLGDYRGRALVLYFYPKDDTPGCTKQAIAFSEHLEGFGKSGAAILGVSRDGPAKHGKFREKHELKIALASDPEAEAADRYGVWKEKTLYGRKYMGVERSTFLIDAEGRIARIWRNVRVPGHVEQVLEAVRELERKT